MVMPSRFDAAIRAIDAANATDPRTEQVDGITQPKELIYARRMSACLLRIYPQASETLQIAARAQHLCRWQILRSSYPLGRDGYNAWRTACRQHHADSVAEILCSLGYARMEIERVQNVIKKNDLKTDSESQALENVVGVVFVEFYLDAFLADHAAYDEAKLTGILKKTFRKMDGTGHDAILDLPLESSKRSMIAAAM